MLQATVLGPGHSPGYAIDARAHARSRRPGRKPQEHLAQPLSLDPSPTTSSSHNHSSTSYSTFGALDTSAQPSTSRCVDYGDEYLTWGGNEVTWSRGTELVRRFTYDTFDDNHVVCATFAWFADVDSASASPSRHSPPASSFTGPACTRRASSSTPPPNTFGPFHKPPGPYAGVRPSDEVYPRASGSKRRAVVVVLPNQAHIYFASGEDSRLSMPFRLAAVWPLPSGGLIVQRALEPRERRAREHARANGKRPRDSAASAFDRTMMSVLDDLDEVPAVALPMFYTITEVLGELKVVPEASLTAGGICDSTVPTIVPGSLNQPVNTSHRILYVAPDPYPFIVVYDREANKVVVFRRAIIPLDEEDPPPLLPHQVMLAPEEVLRLSTAIPPTIAPGTRAGRPSLPRMSSVGSLAPSAADLLDRTRHKPRLSTTSHLGNAGDDDDDAEHFPKEPPPLGVPPRNKRIASMLGLGVASEGRLSGLAESQRRSTLTSSVDTSRRLSVAQEKHTAAWEFPKSSLGMLHEDLRETTMMAGLSHDVQRSEVVLERIWEWRPPGRINPAETRVFVSENRSSDSVNLNFFLDPEGCPTSLFTFHVETVASPVPKYVFHKLRVVQCSAAAPVIATRSTILDTLIMSPERGVELMAAGRSMPIDIPRVATVDGRDEVARKLASSLSMTLDGHGGDRGGLVDLVDACGSRVTVVYNDGERVRISLDQTLPLGLARRALEALSYALREHEYEELADAFISDLQARPAPQRLDPGVHWSVLADTLSIKCGIPLSPRLDSRGDMLSAWSTQSDPVLRRLAKRVQVSGREQTVHPPITPAPSTPRVLAALHLVAQDCRLACTTEPELNLIAPLIVSLASAVGRADWVDYWRRVMPTALTKAILTAPAVEMDTSILSTWDEPPDVLTFLERRMVFSATNPFPAPQHLVGGQPSLLGYPKPCTQTELLSNVYGFMAPSPEEYATGRPVPVEGRAHRVVHYMVDHNLSRAWVADLPFGVGIPVLEMIRACSAYPPKGASLMFYTFIGRPDLAANYHLDTSPLGLSGSLYSEPEVPTVGQLLDTSAAAAQKHVHPITLPHVRFGTDRRLDEVERILQTTRPRTMAIEAPKGLSDSEVFNYHQQLVAAIAHRTLAVTVGHGMFAFASRTKPVKEEWIPPAIDLSVKVIQSNTVLTPPVPEGSDWAGFHNGVGSALAYSPDCKGINSHWIAYNRPSPLTPEHAGFILGLGLTGHLRSLDANTAYQYLEERHDHTSVGTILGLGASFAGSQDTKLTKVFSLHTIALLPLGSKPLNQSALVQSVSLVALGLLYAGSHNLRMAEITLQEISRREFQGVDGFKEYREAYNLSAAMAFGLIMVGRGRSDASDVERKMVQQLTLCIHGNSPDIGNGFGAARNAEPHIDTTLTAPGATLALGLMFLKSGRKDIASILSIPQTPLELENVRPEHLLVRTFSRALIMWDETEGTMEWFDAQLPPFIRHQHHNHKRTSHMELNSEIAYFNIIAGACLGLAFRFASAANESIHNHLTMLFAVFDKAAAGQSMTYEGKIRRNTARHALNIVALAAAIQGAGTGELGLTRRLRVSHGQEGASVNYGSHMAMHMALGMLYLGRGYYTLGNSNIGIAALAIACFPRFLPTMGDNTAYPQAFRHLWVFAAEPRCLIARDVDTRESIFIPIKIVGHNGEANNLISPTLVSTLDTFKSIVIDSPRYLPITFDLADPNDRRAIIETRTVWVKRRPGYIDYADDPRGFRSLMVRAGTMSGFDLHYDLISPASPLTVPPVDVIELVTTHSTNPVCIAIARHFSGDAWLEQFARNVLFECLSIDKLLVLGTYLSMALGLLSSDELLLERMAQTRFAHRYYHPQVWDRLFAGRPSSSGGSRRHPIIRQTFLAAMARKLGDLDVPPPARLAYFAGVAPVGDVALSAYLVRNNVPPVRLLAMFRDTVGAAGTHEDRAVQELKVRLVAQRYVDAVGLQYGGGGADIGSGEEPMWKLTSVTDAVNVWRGERGERDEVM